MSVRAAVKWGARFALALPLIVLMSIVMGDFLAKSKAPFLLKILIGSSVGLVGGHVIGEVVSKMVPLKLKDVDTKGGND